MEPTGLSLEEEMEHALGASRGTIHKSGYMVAMGVGIDQSGGRHIFPFPWTNEEEKSEMVSRAKMDMRNIGIITWVFVSEGWVLETKDPKLIPDKPISEMKEKQQGLLAVGTQPGKSLVMTQIFRKINEDFFFDQIKTSGMNVRDNLWGDIFQ